jgi:hypothetical protein
MNPSFGDTYVANPFRFRTLSSNSSVTKESDLRYVWNLNNVQYPQFRAGALNAVYDIAYANDKVYDSSNGCLVSNLSTFHEVGSVQSDFESTRRTNRRHEWVR